MLVTLDLMRDHLGADQGCIDHGFLWGDGGSSLYAHSSMALDHAAVNGR
jgi:hypothetical protein